MNAALIFTALLAGATAYAPFVIPSLSTYQPNGSPEGQTNYYRIAFTVNSTNGATAQSGYCSASWGDNCGLCSPQYPYSTNVPTGSWTPCDSSAAKLGDGASEFAFQLFPYFAIGNFSVAVRQNCSQPGSSGASQVIITGQTHVTNATARYTCAVDPQEVPSAQVHASGDCSIPANGSAVDIAITSAEPACTHATTVDTSFPVTEQTQWGETVLVVGNITQLGSWDTSQAVPLNADQYTASYNLWNGSVALPAGTPLQYKYILQHVDGSLAWECCENRVYVVPSFTCGMATAGNDPDTFRN